MFCELHFLFFCFLYTRCFVHIHVYQPISNKRSDKYLTRFFKTMTPTVTTLIIERKSVLWHALWQSLVIESLSSGHCKTLFVILELFRQAEGTTLKTISAASSRNKKKKKCWEKKKEMLKFLCLYVEGINVGINVCNYCCC